MATAARGAQPDVSFAKDVIRSYADNFERHSYITLGSLSFFVLSLSLFVFLEAWYGNYYPIVVLRLQISLAISVVFVIFVAFFWSLLAKPYFQILVIESACKARQQPHQSLFERMFQTRGKTGWGWRVPLQPSLFILFPMFLSLGFALSTIISMFDAFPLFVYYDTAANRFNPPHPPIGPFILVVALFTLLFVFYLEYPKRVQRKVLWLFALPPSLLFVVLFFQINLNASAWWRDIVLGLGPPNIVANELMFISSRLALLVILVVILYLIYHYNVKFRDFYVYLGSRDSRDLIENVEALLPKRIHIGDAQSIFLDLKRSELCKERHGNDETYRPNEHLEVEVQAAGLKIDGDKRVTACETSSISTSTWNCSFPTAGTQAINLLISVIQPPNGRDIVFAYKHDIRVDNFLSESWKPLVAILTPILPILVNAVIR